MATHNATIEQLNRISKSLKKTIAKIGKSKVKKDAKNELDKLAAKHSMTKSADNRRFQQAQMLIYNQMR